MNKKKTLAKLFVGLSLIFTPIVGIASSFDHSPTMVSAYVSAKEDFLSRYNEIREKQHNENRSVCDTTKEEYQELVNLYSSLSSQEKKEVNALNDPYDSDYTIEEVMKEIVHLFYGSKDSNGIQKKRLDQSTTIIIAVIVSIFGMSAISVLYILKNNKYIE